MLVLAGVCGHLGDFRLGDFEGVHPAHALTSGVDLKHNARRGGSIHAEDALENVDDELHRGVIVVQQNDLVERRALELGLGLLCDQLAFMPCALFRHQRRRIID